MGDKNLGLGSAELTRLWSKSESNLEACRTPKRQFIPTITDFFQEAMVHADPGQRQKYNDISNNKQGGNYCGDW